VSSRRRFHFFKREGTGPKEPFGMSFGLGAWRAEPSIKLSKIR
jgi:hypothetical protein